MHFGMRIKKARKLVGLTQKELAKIMSHTYAKRVIKRTAIAQWERGDTKEISGGNLLKVAKVLKVNPVWIVFGDKYIKVKNGSRKQSARSGAADQIRRGGQVFRFDM